MFVLVAVSSRNTSRVVSRYPCWRIQRRRARATSARCCSAAGRLFFEADPMALEKAPNRAPATWNPPLLHHHHDLIQRSVRLLANQSQKSFGIILQNRTATPARLRCRHAVIVPSLQPFDRRTRTDLEALSRLVPRRALFYRSNYSLTQVTRIRFRHRRPPADRSESMPIDSLIRND